MTDWRITVQLWAISLLAGFMVAGAKIAITLYGALAPEPPSDPVALRHWKRRRRGIAVTEIAATPCFATAAVALTYHYNLPPPAAVIISMVLGFIGFTLLLDGLQYFFKQKLGMAQPQTQLPIPVPTAAPPANAKEIEDA